MSVHPILLVHGGAGVVGRNIPSESKQAIRAALRSALQRGHACLQAEGSALDAVCVAVVALEDAPHFNAGRGAVFTHEGRNELDAAVMEGATLRAGAIAGVRGVRNPVLLARAVMERSPHVMLIGDGAEAFAREHSFEFAAPEYFHTEERWIQLQDALARATQGESQAQDYFGTVGAVALDTRGCLAAATSTGGMTDKRWGRVGDSPIIGAGTYANAHCAVSCTGHGEFYIRACAAHAICLRVADLHQAAADAAEQVVNRVIPGLGGSGGAIVLGADGTFAMPFNTEGMYRGWIGAGGECHVRIWQDD
ncbi:MAG: isoaspartyl peptidase/L-asparaginase family protein [Rhodanobacteraceae bacterium]